jgi:hypothetical protein
MQEMVRVGSFFAVSIGTYHGWSPFDSGRITEPHDLVHLLAVGHLA